MASRILLFSFLIVVGFAASDSAQSYPADLKPCQSEPTVLCGKLRVYEDPHHAAGRTIDLNVVVLPSLGERRFDPLFDIAGGPGVGVTVDLELFVKEIPQYREGRDIVLVDQRGTGGSNPLKCDPLPASTSLDEMYPVEYVRQCRKALETHADLTKYTTEIAMDDLDAVRKWLGYKKIDLFGLSYGTRAAQVYARQHSGSTDKIVLMGAIGTYHKMPFYHAPNAQASLDLLLAECEHDDKCHAAFPGIREDLRSAIKSLREKPAEVTFTDPKTKAANNYTIRADIFAEQIRKWLYTRDSTQSIPFVIHNAAHGNFKPFLTGALRPSDPGFIADGMYLSVTCAEDVPFIDVGEAAKLSRDTIFGDYRVVQQKRACAEWPRGEIGKNYRDRVVSDVPALFLTGGMDPVTAPAWADELAKGFKNAVMIRIPEQGHGPGGVSNVECEDRLIIRFLSNLSISAPDTACVATMKADPFMAEPTPQPTQ
ncbi:MAG TPA: alpha/beta fold hydrolase [Pyrinomonadaceae bacterium]|jgi:pimeloyl-ACP methyl ester carboxylesterase